MSVDDVESGPKLELTTSCWASSSHTDFAQFSFTPAGSEKLAAVFELPSVTVFRAGPPTDSRDKDRRRLSPPADTDLLLMSGADDASSFRMSAVS